MLVVAAAGGVGGWAAWEQLGAALAGRPSKPPAGLAAGPSPAPANLGQLVAAPGRAAVVDGDTLRLQDDVVRLAGVAAPSRGDRCAPGLVTMGVAAAVNDAGEPSRDCAAAAAAQLASLVHDHPVSCEVVGHDRLGRMSARCDVGPPGLAASKESAGPRGSLNQQIVASGWARAATADLEGAELAARASHRGLWADGGAP